MVETTGLITSLISLGFFIVHSLETSDIPKCPRDGQYCISSCEDRNVTDSPNPNYNICASTLRHRIINPTNGVVAFSVLIPYESVEEKNDISFRLMARKEGPEVGDGLCSYEEEKFELHSWFMMSTSHQNPSIDCSPNQLVKVEWQFNYLFTGCYFVEVVLNPACNRAFKVESNFKKDLLADKEIKMQPKVVGNTINILALSNNGLFVNDCNNPMGPSQCVELHVSRGAEELWIYRVYDYGTADLVIPNSNSEPRFLHSRLCLYYKDSASAECTCEWNEARLECEFRDIPPGNYSIDLEVLDTRCNRGTLWTIGPDPCIWRHVGIIVKNITELSDPEVAWKKSSFSEYWLILLPVMVLGAVCLSICVVWNKRKTLIPPPSDELEISATDQSLLPPKVFFLYPRDCKEFMDVMAELRTLLKISVKAEVHDIWDDKVRDAVDERGEIWGLEHLLSSDEVLVLIVATPVSRLIEKAILEGCEVTYSEPDSRDEIFVSAYITAIRKYELLREPCRKFVVTRIDSPGCAENILKTFESPLNTIYTLPGHLDLLLSHLTDCRRLDQKFKVYNVERLRKSINSYAEAISRNSHNLDLIVEAK